MKNPKQLRKILLLAALGSTSCLSFAAGTATTTFQVSATIADTCSIAALPLAFGAYDQLSLTPKDSTTTITVKCSLNVPATISLDNGLPSGNPSSRTMKQGSDELNYALFSDAARQQNWATTANEVVAFAGKGLGPADAASLTVFGRIPAGQNTIGKGSYLDTITATISY